MKDFAEFAVLYRRKNGEKLQVLLIQDSDKPGKWKLAGGKSEPGEQQKQALIRELHQELGITVDVGSISKKIYSMSFRTHTFIAYAVPHTRRFGAFHMHEVELLRKHWFDLQEVKRLINRGQVLPHHTSALLDFIEWQET